MVFLQTGNVMFQGIDGGAAMIPAWRMAPPISFRVSLAALMNSLLPHSTEPTGAPRPLEKQNCTESTY